MPRCSKHRSTAALLQRLWAGLLLAGSCLGGEPGPVAPPMEGGWQPALMPEIAPEEILAAPGFAEPGDVEPNFVEPQIVAPEGTMMPPAACPPASFWSRLTQRVVPSSDLIGMPLHHRNFAGDCYGENWRIRQFDLSTRSGRHRQRWHNHSLAMEHYWGEVFGKPPRGYIHDSSGHPMRGFFVPQPGDPTIAYQPGSDTLMPSRIVADYPLYVYGQGPCKACETEEEGEAEKLKVISPR